MKRRLADSKVISDCAPIVELNMGPAFSAWFKGHNKNFGVTVEVEDQDLNVLKPHDYFKGTNCLTSSSKYFTIKIIYYHY